MRKALCIAAMAALGGCSLQTQAIRTNALVYSDVIEQTVDKMMLTNVLEARDNAPLHFVEFPKINASLKAGASVSSGVPFLGGIAGNPNSIYTGTVTPNISIESQPTFEVDNFAAKDFVTGMSSPIDPKFIKYWFDRGLNKRLLLMMFFSSVQIIHKTSEMDRGTSITIRNSPRQTADQIADCMAVTQPSADAFHPGGKWDDCHARTPFEDYLRMVNDIADYFTANAYSELTKLTDTDTPLSPQQAAGIDLNKFRVRSAPVGVGRNAKTIYTLYSASAEPRMALCLGDLELLQGVVPSPATVGDVCTSPEVVHNASPQTTASVLAGRPRELLVSPIWAASPVCDGAYRTHYPNERTLCSEYLDFMARFQPDNLATDGTVRLNGYAVKLSIRSVAEMIRFLGDLQYLQETMARLYVAYGKQRPDTHHNMPVTIGYDIDCHKNDAMLTRAELDETACATRDSGFLFRLNGKPVGDIAQVRFTLEYHGQSYAVVQGDRRDHTLEVLSIMNQLVNLNKSAADIRPTPIFQLQ